MRTKSVTSTYDYYAHGGGGGKEGEPPSRWQRMYVSCKCWRQNQKGLHIVTGENTLNDRLRGQISAARPTRKTGYVFMLPGVHVLHKLHNKQKQVLMLLPRLKGVIYLYFDFFNGHK